MKAKRKASAPLTEAQLDIAEQVGRARCLLEVMEAADDSDRDESARWLEQAIRLSVSIGGKLEAILCKLEDAS